VVVTTAGAATATMMTGTTMTGVGSV
jgi:hypothetical protein